MIVCHWCTPARLETHLQLNLISGCIYIFFKRDGVNIMNKSSGNQTAWVVVTFCCWHLSFCRRLATQGQRMHDSNCTVFHDVAHTVNQHCVILSNNQATFLFSPLTAFPIMQYAVCGSSNSNTLSWILKVYGVWCIIYTFTLTLGKYSMFLSWATFRVTLCVFLVTTIWWISIKKHCVRHWCPPRDEL